jgi:hypothetical protein
MHGPPGSTDTIVVVAPFVMRDDSNIGRETGRCRIA